MNKSNPPPPWQAETAVWSSPEFDPEDLDAGRPVMSRHMMISDVPDPGDPFAEPHCETVIATEDDFEDDCPLCEMMRERVRAGEEIEITRVTWD